MDINLGYIEGISYIDTPYFSSITAQSDYFDNHLVKVIHTTYYPPHYRNRIRFDTEDIDLTTQVNYLWFEYGSKVYYYFINSIDYINENIIEFDISMDVIQTFMFNINVHNGVIERKFIDRYEVSYSNNINRNYIRENVSNGIFVDEPKKYLGPLDLGCRDDDKWIVIKATCYDIDHTDRTYITYIDTDDNHEIKSSFVYIVIPYTKVTEYHITQAGYDVDLKEGYVFDAMISTLLKSLSPYICDTYVIPYFPYDSGTYIDSRKKLIIEDTTYFSNFEAIGPAIYHSDPVTPYEGKPVIVPMFISKYAPSEMLPTTPLGSISDYSSKVKVVTKDYQHNILSDYFPLIKNTSIGTVYNKYYLTQLFDENYINIEFGCDNALTSLPLFRMEKYEAYIKMWLNLDSGIVNYNLYNSNFSGVGYNNVYDSIVQDVNVPYYDLIVDSYSEYSANNRSRWTAALIDTGAKTAKMFVEAMSIYGFAASKIDSIKSKPGSYDRRYKDLTLKQSSQAKINSISEQAFWDTFGMGSPADAVMKLGFQETNMKYAPDASKQISNAGAKILINDTKPFTRFRHVNDIESVAYYYHTNGYLVNQPYPLGTENIFEYIQNRYYFNVIKFSEIDLHLYDYIEDDELIENIKNRFIDGLRLWNVNNNLVIGDFTHDNVELDYLN